MDKFIATIQLNTGKIITCETENRNKEVCEDYWDNYIKYWGKVHRDWNCATVLKIEEVR